MSSMRASTPQSPMSRRAIAKSPAPCWARRLPHCTEPEYIDLQARTAHSRSLLRAHSGCRSPEIKRADFRRPLISCDRPDPNNPGGLGAEESETERTGPTQYLLVPSRGGGRLAEVG